MRLGISTYTYGWAVGSPGNRPPYPLQEIKLMDLAVRFGLGVVQFGDNWPLHEVSAERLRIIRQRAIRDELTLEVGARGMTESHLHDYLDLTHKLGSRLLRFVIDADGYAPSTDAVVTLLREAVPALEATGVTLGIENHDRLLAREFADIIERVGSTRVGICLDSVNSMGAGEGIAEVVRTLAPYTVNLHLKDFGIQRLPHLMGFQIDGRPAGQGLLDIPWLVEQVSPYGRCQTAILEQWVVPDPDLPATIAKEMTWAETSIDYLQKTGLFR